MIRTLGFLLLAAQGCAVAADPGTVDAQHVETSLDGADRTDVYIAVEYWRAAAHVEPFGLVVRGNARQANIAYAKDGIVYYSPETAARKGLQLAPAAIAGALGQVMGRTDGPTEDEHGATAVEWSCVQACSPGTVCCAEVVD